MFLIFDKISKRIFWSAENFHSSIENNIYFECGTTRALNSLRKSSRYIFIYFNKKLKQILKTTLVFILFFLFILLELPLIKNFLILVSLTVIKK